MISNDEILVEYVDKLKEEVKDLKSKNKELKENLKKRRKIVIDFRGLRDAFNHWTFSTAVVIACICGAVYFIVYLCNLSHETGRFYLSHHSYTIREPIKYVNCYAVVKEIKYGQDKVVSECITDEATAHEAVRRFTDQWRALKEGARD